MLAMQEHYIPLDNLQDVTGVSSIFHVACHFLKEERENYASNQVSLSLNLLDLGSHALAIFVYNPLLYSEFLIESMAKNLGVILANVCMAPSLLVRQVPYIHEEEYQKLVHDWSKTVGASIDVKHFEEVAKLNSNNIAVLAQEDSITYQQLDTFSTHLAHELVSLGVKPESLVGICVDQSSWRFIVTILGIWKAGGAYIP